MYYFDNFTQHVIKDIKKKEAAVMLMKLLLKKYHK